MKRATLWKFSVTTTAEAEDAVVALLETIFALPVSVYFNERTKKSLASVYAEDRLTFSTTKQAELSAGLKRLKADGILTTRPKISVERLAKENWAESWKKHFKPIEVGDALLLKPSWSKRRVRKGQAEVVLDPGLSFGTGHHATTGFCLRQLARCRKRGQAQSFLDIGTGSGILAIAAAKLGYAPVVAFDFDPEAVRVARENARKNRAAKQIQLSQADLTKLPSRGRERYDFICANLISTLLVAECGRIANRLKPGGILVVAGILRKEFFGVRKVFAKLGLKFLSGRCEKEWRSGAFAAKKF